MSPFVLSVLKYALLVLLYFFVFRAVRSVTMDVAGRRQRATGPSTPPAATASRGRKAPTQVVIHDPDAAKPRTVRLSDSAQIGRAGECAIRLSDTYVSQMHARLFGRDGGWFVEDLGSTNGTFLNDHKVVEPVQVHAGDVVKVGKTVLELRR